MHAKNCLFLALKCSNRAHNELDKHTEASTGGQTIPSRATLDCGQMAPADSTRARAPPRGTVRLGLSPD